MGKTANTKSERARGALGRGAVWCWQHPGVTTVMTGAPLTVATSVVQLGALTTGFIAAGVVGAGTSWRSVDRDSFDSIAGTRLRAAYRRWHLKSPYRGKRWTEVMEACDLYKEHKASGRTRVPRLVKLQAVTPSIDLLTVQLCLGVSLRKFLNSVDELTPALDAEQLKITKVPGKPKLIKIVVVRRNPFEDVEVEATEIPDDVSEVDFRGLPIGENELADVVTMDLLGNHLLVYGRMGAGKAGGLWNLLRAMGPAIREEHVYVDGIDPKIVELEPGRKVFRRLVTDPKDFLPLITEFRDRMNHRKDQLKAAGLRKVPGVTKEYPLQVLMMDELLMVIALSEDAKEIVKLLIEIMSQGRALGFVVCGYIQAAEKDVLSIRDFFTRRICLAASAASHVDMVLGDGMRDRGALADQIMLPNEAGVGYLVCSDFKATGKGFKFYAPGDPMRIRLGLCEDGDVAELADECAPYWGAEVISLPTVQRGPSFMELDVDEQGDGLDFEPGEIEQFAVDGATTTIPAMVPSTLDLLDRMSGYTNPADVRGA